MHPETRSLLKRQGFTDKQIDLLRKADAQAMEDMKQPGYGTGAGRALRSVTGAQATSRAAPRVSVADRLNAIAAAHYGAHA